MAEVIRMPRMSDTMEEGVIVQWLKSVGDKVAPGDILAEVETDKATMELESFYEGYLLHIGAEKGAVPVDGILAVIGDKDEDYKKALKQAEESTDGKSSDNEDQSDEGEDEGEDADEKSKEQDDKEKKKESTSMDKEKSDSQSDKKEGSSSSDDGDRIKASPLAKKIAEEKGIDLSMVSGSGDHGRIVKRDIEDYKPQPSDAGGEVGSFGGLQDFEYGSKPVSQMRKTIARRLAESKYSAPHFYLTIEINMDKAVGDREEINQDKNVKVSFNDFIVKACAMALRRHPAVNSSWKVTEIEYHRAIHIGVAVAVDEGLLVPVVRDADQKSFTQINAEVKDYAQRARSKKLQLEEMQGSTFTISNLGMFGIEEFTAIINPPDSCILAVGAIVKKPVVVDDELQISSMMKVTMSCDHRVVDGATGAQFLQTLKTYLENPVRMLAY